MKKIKVLAKDIHDPILREICQKHGTAWLLSLADLKHCETIYIPKRDTLEEKSRDRLICQSEEPVRELARIFNLTPRRIQQIKKSPTLPETG